MQIYVTRDSVCAGDDGDAPHAQTFTVPGETTVAAAVEHVVASRYLPSISGGLATWSVSSGIPVAVAAQQWSRPRHFHVYDGLRRLDVRDGVLRLHFSYHTQLDPEIVATVLQQLQQRAS